MASTTTMKESLRLQSTQQRAFRPAKPSHKGLRVVCQASQDVAASRRQAMGALASLGLSLVAGPTMAEPFLASTGAKGMLVAEEERLYRLRVEKEGEARAALDQERQLLETEVKQSQDGKFCATPFGVDVVGITEFVALVGALVGGVTARKRKDEVERLNEQLRAINLSLRQQARAGTVYAPGLSYAPSSPSAAPPAAPIVPPVVRPLRPASPAPSSSTNGAPAAAAAAAATAVAEPVTVKAAPAAIEVGQLSTMLSMEEEEMSTDQLQCRDALRAGKRLLKERNGSAAMVRFEKALMLSKALGDRVQERRAIRGLAASCRLTHQHRQAIKHLERVLDISREMAEYTGDADAYGTIADCYTDMGDLEMAATFYDKYIERMNREGPV